MTDPSAVPVAPTGPAPGRRRPRLVLAAALLATLVVAGGALAYRLTRPPPAEEDAGVVACRSLEVLARAERGDDVTLDEVRKVALLFLESEHEDLRRTGSFVAGMAERLVLQRSRGNFTILYEDALVTGLPELTGLCAQHGVRVEG